MKLKSPSSNMPHSIQCRVYYEDTDAGGIVYYANYLKFAERARTEWLRRLGINQSQLTKEYGIYFVVRKVESDFPGSARLDDLLTIETHLQEATKVRMRMQQIIKRDAKTLVELNTMLACINTEGKVAKIPEAISYLITKENIW